VSSSLQPYEADQGSEPNLAEADPRNAPMSEEELMAIVTGEIDRAKDFTLGTIGKERATAYDYYYGRPFGNEEEGRSKIISHDVAQQIDSAVPALIKFFAGSDKAVEFTPRKKEDVQAAEQATEVCNYVFYTQNNGFMLLHDAIKNALLQKTGCFKWYWEKSTKVEEETYYGLPRDLIEMLKQDPQLEQIGESPSERQVMDVDPMTGQPVELFDVKFRRKTGSGRVRVIVIPPDEMLVSDNAYGMDADEIPCMTHRTEKTLSDLVEMGYDMETVLGLSSEEPYSYENESQRARTGDTQGSGHEIPDEMMKKVWYDETYIKLDFDRDGTAERRKVCSVGGTLLHNEVITSVPLSFGTTKIMPHEFFGVSMADEVMDLQLRKSALLRQMNDNLMLANAPRMAVDTQRITNLDDVMTVRMGGIIRSNGDATGAVQPVVTPFVAQHVFPMIEYIDSEEETRTGVSRLMQGVDPNTLNKTATGVNALMNAAQARIELVARGMAETLIKPMFKGIMELLGKHQEEAQALTIRLRNEYVPIDPRVWDTEYDMTVNVGLGTGTKDQQMQHLSNLMMVQQQLFMGPFGQMFPPNEVYTKIYNAASKLAETAGFKDPNLFFPDPQILKPPQPQPPPEVQKAQMQIEADQQKHQADMEMRGQEMQAEQQFKAQEMQQEQQFKMQELQMEMMLKKMEMMMDAKLEEYKIGLQAQVQTQVGMAQAYNQPQAASER
jgi:hypothetical protein